MVDATQAFAPPRQDKLPVFGTIGSTFRVFAAAPVPFLLLAFATQIPGLLRLLIAPPLSTKFSIGSAAVGVLNLLFLLFTQTVMTYMAVRIVDGQSADIGEGARLGVRRYLPMLGTMILIMLAIYGGMILLIVPGIILACMFAVAVPVCVLEATGPVTSMRRSSFLTKGSRWRVLGVYLVFFVPLMIVSTAITFLITMRGHLVGGMLFSTLLQLIWVPIATIFSAMIYVELRRLKETTGVAHVFD